MLRPILIAAALIAGLAFSGPVYAACSTTSPLASGHGDPSQPTAATRLETQTSDNVRITGGCVDVPNLYINGITAMDAAGSNAALPDAPANLGLQVAAKCDGSTDDTAVINAALLAASTAANGKLSIVTLPAGTCMTAGLTTYTDVWLRGQGVGQTILKLKNNACTSVITTNGAVALFGTGSTGGVYDYRISDLTIDGNYNNQTGCSDYDLVNGITSYGKHFRWANLYIQNVRGNGARSEWASGSANLAPPPEAMVFDTNFDTCGRRCLWWNGPHDSQIVRTVAVNASQEADRTYSSIVSDANGISHFILTHPWMRSTATNRQKAGYELLSGGNTLLGIDAEGGYEEILQDAGSGAINRITGGNIVSAR